MGKDVTRNIEEQLSAFIDGELPDDELQMLVRRLERDEEHRATLMRYALIGNVMRNDPVQSSANRFMAGVMTAIDSDAELDVKAEDETATSELATVSTRWFKPLASAAAVVFAVVGLGASGLLQNFSAPNLFEQTSEQTMEIAANDVSSASAGQQQVTVAGAVAPAAEESALVAATSQPVARRSAQPVSRPAYSRRNVVNRERMTSYLVSHGDYASSLQGPMGDSRIFIQQARFER